MGYSPCVAKELDMTEAIWHVMKLFVKPLRKEGHSDVWGQKSGDLGENMLPQGKTFFPTVFKKADCHCEKKKKNKTAL